MAYSVTIYGEELTKIKNLEKYLREPDLKLVQARAVTNMLRDHFFDYDRSHPNKLGGSRSHFYGQAARGTTYRIDPQAIVVSVNQVGIRQRWQGGTITAGMNPSRFTGKPTKYLALPAIAEAYGKRPGEFSNLTTAWGRSGPYALVEAVATLTKGRKVRIGKGQTVSERKKSGVGGRVYYWLTPRVTQQGDPGVVPDEKEFVETLDKVSSAYIKRRWEKN
jgi:hypothetical protein